MNTTRNGKIARLPRAIREALNQRLADGQSGPEILDWLHDQILVLDVLDKHFDGRDITEKNLSEWRQGGYQDWLKLQETRALAIRFFEHGQTVAEDIEGQSINDSVATLLAVEFARLSQAMLGGDMDLKERWACLGDIQRRLSRLRRDDHYAGELALKRERWSRQVETEQTAAVQAADKEERRQHITRYRFLRSGLLQLEAKSYGNDDLGRDIAAMSLEEEHNLKFGMLGRKSDYFALPTDPDEPIYPWRRTRSKAAAASAPEPASAPASPIEPEAIVTPATSEPPVSPDPTAPPPAPDTKPEPPPADPIALANDLPPHVTAGKDPVSIHPPSDPHPSGEPRCRPARSTTILGERQRVAKTPRISSKCNQM